MLTLRQTYAEQGYVLLRSFFDRREVETVRDDAKDVFLRQMRQAGVIDGNDPSEREFEAGMARFFEENAAAFMNAGKVCQHLISLHRLSLTNALVRQLHDLGLEAPVICTRPVIYFNTRKLGARKPTTRPRPIKTGAASRGRSMPWWSGFRSWISMSNWARSSHTGQPPRRALRVAARRVVPSHRGRQRRGLSLGQSPRGRRSVLFGFPRPRLGRQHHECDPLVVSLPL